MQICELCKIEFDGPITLGMHLLLHIYGRMPTKEVEISTLAAVLQGSAQQKGPSERSELEKSNADSNQMATRMYTRLLEQSAKDTLGEIEFESRFKEISFQYHFITYLFEHWENNRKIFMFIFFSSFS